MLNIYKLKKNNLKNTITKKGCIVKESIYKPTSSKVWFNSIYSFNKNNQKSLPSINITVSNIIKSYFNMFSVKLEKGIIGRISNFKRSLKLNRILLGKPEFKHTNDKVIITLYIYNRELSLLNKKMNKLKQKIFMQHIFKLMIINKLNFTKLIMIKKLLKKFDHLKQKLQIMEHFKININKFFGHYYNRYAFKVIKDFRYKRVIFDNLNKIYDLVISIKTNARKKISWIKTLNRMHRKIRNLRKKHSVATKLLNMKNKFTEVNYLSSILSKTISKSSFNVTPKFNITKLMYIKVLKKITLRIRLYLRYNRVIYFNKSKFNIFIKPLKYFLEKIYKKEVEFNIVNLKNYHLDSNILTQIMAIKLRNRKNKIGKILTRVVKIIKLPFSKKLQYYKLKRKPLLLQNLLIKHIINNNVYKALPNIKVKTFAGKYNIELLKLIETKKDKLDMILNLSYPIEYVISNINSNVNYLVKRDIRNTILDNIKNKAVTGIKVQATGRLSKRMTASKSINKIEQLGTTKEINSSYKKLSSVLLRGKFKSNIQYSKASNKTRIGAFGVKGWIGSV